MTEYPQLFKDLQMTGDTQFIKDKVAVKPLSADQRQKLNDAAEIWEEAQ